VTSVLFEGCSGVDVLTLQKLLGITADGIFGKQTGDAVEAYQRKNGLEPDRKVGPITWALIHPKYKQSNVDRSAKFKTGPLAEKIIETGLGYEGLKEESGNRGELIDKWNAAMDVPKGSPWCMSAVQQWVFLACRFLGIPNPLDKYKTAHCFTLWMKVPRDWRHTGPMSGERGDIVIFEFSHTGIVLRNCGDGWYETLEANTNEAGEREGKFVMRKRRKWNTIAGFIRLPEVSA
jgi:hypothetical protein